MRDPDRRRELSRKPDRALADGVVIRAFDARDEAAVIALWHDCELTRPWNDPQRDIARKLGEQPELFLVADSGGVIVGSVMSGYDGHRGWIYYLAVSPARRRESIGARLVRAAEALLLARGCPKVNLMIRTSNAAVVAFYQHLGYEVEDIVGMGRRMIQDQ